VSGFPLGVVPIFTPDLSLCTNIGSGGVSEFRWVELRKTETGKVFARLEVRGSPTLWVYTLAPETGTVIGIAGEPGETLCDLLRWRLEPARNPVAAARPRDTFYPAMSVCFDHGTTSPVSACSVSWNESLLLLGTETGGVSVWLLDKLYRLAELRPNGVGGRVNRLGFGDAGRKMLAVASDSLAVWHVDQMELLLHQRSPEALPFHDAAFSPDGRVVVVACGDGSVRFLDAEAWDELRRYDWGIGPVRSVAFSPDGLLCAAGGEKGQVVVWDVDE
jgi:WD40 repeat protein